MSEQAHAHAVELIAEGCALPGRGGVPPEALARLHDALVSCLAEVTDPVLADDAEGVATALAALLDELEARPAEAPALTG